MSAALKLDEPLRYSWEAYEAALEASQERLEFHDGVVISMAGGTDVHSLIKSNVVGELRAAMRKRPCRVYDSDMKVRVEATNQGLFPDASIVCGHSTFENLYRRSLLNPNLIVEVTSESSDEYDHGKKFWHYRHLSSLHTFVLISSESVLVEVFERMTGDEWRLRTFEGLEAVVKLEHAELELPIGALYEKTSFVDGAEEA